jgi:hypothetical protein
MARKLADELRRKRPSVEVPPPPPAPGGLLDKAKDEEWRDWHGRWLAVVRERQAKAILKLANERDADPMELVKVADLLVDFAPPDRRGKSGVDGFRMLIHVAVELTKDKSERVACDLAGVDVDTFRKYRDEDPRVWAMIKDYAKLAVHFSEDLSWIDDDTTPFPWPVFPAWPPRE